jgi:hypothetical protein
MCDTDLDAPLPLQQFYVYGKMQGYKGKLLGVIVSVTDRMHWLVGWLMVMVMINRKCEIGVPWAEDLRDDGQGQSGELRGNLHHPPHAHRRLGCLRLQHPPLPTVFLFSPDRARVCVRVRWCVCVCVCVCLRGCTDIVCGSPGCRA